MIEREAIFPLCLGLIVAIALHLAAVSGYAHLQRQPPTPPTPTTPDSRTDLAARITAPSPVPLGQPFEIQLTIANLSPHTAPPAACSLSINNSPTALSPSPTLPPGKSISITHTITLDSPGIALLAFNVDADHQLEESDESNNLATLAIVVQAPTPPGAPGLPDYAVFDIKLPDRPLAGRPTPFEVQIANLGQTPVSTIPLAITLDDQIVQTLALDARLAPGQMVTIPLEVTAPTPGPHRLCVIADPQQAIPETDESNNTHCITAQWVASDPTRQPGQVEPSDTVNLNLVSYEAFKQIVAEYEERFDQPLVQMTADPIPTNLNPLDPTDPANPQPTSPGSTPSPPSTPTPPIPALADQQDPGEQPQDPASPSAQLAVDQPSDQDPHIAPSIPDRPADLATAPRQADQPAPAIASPRSPDSADTPVSLVDQTPATNQANQPRIAAQPSEQLALTDPPIRIEQSAPDASVPLAVKDVPESPLVDRLTPDITPVPGADPADRTLAIDAQPGEKPQPAALTTEPDPDSQPASPQSKPVEIARADSKLTQPDAPVDPLRPTQPKTNPTVSTPTPTTPTPARTPAPAAQQGNAAQPTPVERADLESPPVSRIRAIQVEPGATLTIQGVQIKTVRPRFSPVAQGTAVPNNPIYTIRFDAQGKVIDIQEIRGTGWTTYDAPLLTALYKWQAQGNIAPEGFVIERLLLKLRPD